MKEQYTVESLRKAGCKVGVRHQRRYNHKLVSPLLPRGGRTTVTITSSCGQNTVVGKARCSKEDIYCKRTGVEIAMGRAIEKINQQMLDYDKKTITVTVEGQMGFITITPSQALMLRDQLNTIL